MHLLQGVPYVPVWVTYCAVVAHWYIYATLEVPRSTTSLLFTSQYLCATILLTLYSMVWNWRFSMQGQCFYWPTLLAPFVLNCFPYILSSYGLALWSWGI